MKKIVSVLLLLLILAGIFLFIRENSHSRGYGKTKTMFYTSFPDRYSLEIPISGYEMYGPSYLYFGTDLKTSEILSRISESLDIKKMEMDEQKGYMLVNQENKTSFFSLYVRDEPFDDKTRNSFLIYNGAVDLYTKDHDEYLGSVLFPDIVLASTPKEILEQGGVSVEIGQRYLLRDSSYTLNCFQKMYESMELYKMKITQDEIQFEPLAGDWEDETIYKGRWSMKITDGYIVFQAEKMGGNI